MIAEAGHFALILAFCIALVQAVVPLVGAARGKPRWMAIAAPAAQAQALLVVASFAALGWAFAGNDFSVRYVAGHSNTGLPLEYRLAAIWGGHEGSMLLWMLMLCGWSNAVAFAARRLPPTLVARVLGVLGIVAAGLLAFILFASNPFLRVFPAPTEGRELNPLLQDPGMIFHPPLLYMGYVGFSVVFAFSIAALLEGRLDAAWTRWTRPWTTAAWACLTAGIALGSFWAYYELGWGGWWFWDPVENASFMPWLAGTALIHSLAVTEKRGLFKSWTVLLGICVFGLSLMGTFLVRSGVLTSVHAFATDPRRGVFILAYLTLVIGASLLLFAWRAPRLAGDARFHPVSREAALLVNNALLFAALGAVMLGTLYPLVVDALGLGKLSVGPPYFEAVFVPLMVPVVLLTGIGPLLRWRAEPAAPLWRRLRSPLLLVAAGALVVPVATGNGGAMTALGLGLAGSIFAGAGLAILPRLRSRPPARWPEVLPRAFVGMIVAHVGLAAFVLGVTVSRTYETTAEVPLRAGEQGRLAGFDFLFESIGEVNGPNYLAARATVRVLRDQQPASVLHPEKRLYKASGMPMTEAAIDATLTRHLYVALGEMVGSDQWLVRIQHKPLIGWIWGGCVVMVVGGVLACTDRRYRVASRAQRVLVDATPAPSAAG